MRKILVVDDNEAITDMVAMILSGTYEVLKSNNGMDGMRMAVEAKPDLILLDVMMPMVSGVEMLRQLQADPTVCSIPVIVMTATQFDPETKAMFQREPNVVSFLGKPCAVDALCSAVEGVLSKPNG